MFFWFKTWCFLKGIQSWWHKFCCCPGLLHHPFEQQGLHTQSYHAGLADHQTASYSNITAMIVWHHGQHLLPPVTSAPFLEQHTSPQAFQWSQVRYFLAYQPQQVRSPTRPVYLAHYALSTVFQPFLPHAISSINTVPNYILVLCSSTQTNDCRQKRTSTTIMHFYHWIVGLISLLLAIWLEITDKTKIIFVIPNKNLQGQQYNVQNMLIMPFYFILCNFQASFWSD